MKPAIPCPFSRKASIGYDMVTLNHYILRSAESFLVKRQRGRINHVDQDQGLTYWKNRNYATEEDHSIQRNLPRASEVYERLLRDQKLFSLHQSAVDWHQERIQTLKGARDYLDLFHAITDPALRDAIYVAELTSEVEGGESDDVDTREIAAE